MLNRAVVMGRLPADPELRYTPNNVAVATFTFACGRSYVKQGAERQTDWIDVVAWRQTAEFVSKYFKKGQLMAVEGTIQTRMYEDKNGNKRKAVEIVAENAFFCDSKQSGAPSSTGSDFVPQTDSNNDQSSFMQGALDDFEEIALDAEKQLPF